MGLLQDIGEQRFKDAERIGRLRSFGQQESKDFDQKLMEALGARGTSGRRDFHALVLDAVERGWKFDQVLSTGLDHPHQVFQAALELSTNPTRFMRAYLPAGGSEKASESLAILRLIIQGGGDINHRDADGRTLLHWAAWSKSAPEVFVFLIDMGADPHIPSAMGRTPMEYIKNLGVDGAYSAIDRMELQKLIVEIEEPKQEQAEVATRRRRPGL